MKPEVSPTRREALQKQGRHKATCPFKGDLHVSTALRRAEGMVAMLQVPVGASTSEDMAAALVEYEPLLKSVARRLSIRLDDEDALQFARMTAFEALRRYERGRGVPRSAFVAMCVRRALINYVTPLASAPSTVPLDDSHDIAIDDERVALIQEGTFQRVHAFLRQLPPGKRELVFRVFWLDEQQSDIARKRGVSRSNITQELNRIFAAGREVLGSAPIATAA